MIQHNDSMSGLVRSRIRLCAPILSLALLAIALGAGPAAAGPPVPPAPSWRILGPVSLGSGPLFHAVPYPGATGWSSSGSSPVLSTGSRGTLIAWAGPDSEVLAAWGTLQDGTWRLLPRPGAALTSVGQTPEIDPASDPRGDTLLAWASSSGEGGALREWMTTWGYLSAAGPAWQSPFQFTGTGPNLQANSPSVALDTRGDGFALWRPPGGPSLMGSYMPAGTGAWQAPTVVSPTLTPLQSPALAVDSAGDAAAVWLASGPPGPLLVAATRAAGQTWDTPTTLGPTGAPTIAALPGRAAAVVWHVETAGEKAPLFYATADLEHGRWSRPLELTADASDLPNGLAVGAHGSKVAWWTARESGGRVSLQARVRRPGGHFERATTIATWRPATESLNPSNPLCGGGRPLVAFDAREDALAVWAQGCGATFASVLPAGGKRWSVGSAVGRVIGRHATPAFALAPDGDLVAVWLEGSAEGQFGERLPTTVAAAVLQPLRKR